MKDRLSSALRALPVLLAVLLLGSTAGRAACVRAAAAGRRGQAAATAVARTRAVAAQGIIDPVVLEPHSTTPPASFSVVPGFAGLAAVAIAPAIAESLPTSPEPVVPQCSTCAHASRAPPLL